MVDKEEQIYSSNVTEVDSILHTDNDPIQQPKGTHRFALNMVSETSDSSTRFRSNEKSNYSTTVRPLGFEFIGDRYIENDLSVVILTNPTTNQDEIGILTKDNKYTTIVNTSVLKLRITNQCDVRYRLRRGKERVIYWVDSLNKPRTFNLDRPHNFYNNVYEAYLRGGGDPNTFVGEKWDGASFDLIKSYSSVPQFSNVSIIETGNILPGSYNFAIQYVDEDLNPTEWITTSNTVNIFNDSLNSPFPRIRGSRNVHTSSQDFPRANKSIKLTITNLDDSFPFYRVAIIRAAGNTGVTEKALASELNSTSDSNFLYSGNDGNLAEVSLEDILIDKEVIFAPQHIEQIENRLLLMNTKGKSINWCEFQKYASKISSDLTTKEILLNNVLSEPNIKNAKSTFVFRGYMPGEVYSLGIVYLFNDGFVTPAFHIPGKSSSNTTSKMKVYELDDKYLDIHSCSTDNYWGLDSEGDTLVGKSIRHHRFPFRKDVNKPLYSTTGGITNINKFRLKMIIDLNSAFVGPPTPNTYPVDISGNPIVIPYKFSYQITGSPTTTGFSGNLVDTDMGVSITLYDDTTDLTPISGPDYALLDPSSILDSYQGGGTSDRFTITFTYETYVASSSFNDDRSDIFGIQFSNIEIPHPDVVGFYIVRNERTDDDRMILDNAIFGPMTSFQNYKSFGLIMPKQYYFVNNCGRPGNSGKTVTYFDKSSWFFNPEFQYFNKKTEFDSIETEGTYTENAVNMPTISNNANSSCNGGSGADGGSKGVYINDVQAGTSYNPDVNKKKDKDDDGFDLIIGYRNTNISYSINNSFVFPVKDRITYLTAAAYQNFGGDTYYNVSVDNKIGMYLFDTGIDTNVFYNTATRKNSLLYGSLVRDSNSLYSNFITRPYYKEHNNPILFGSSTVVNLVDIFNGDAQISSFNFVSSVFYDMVVADRAKKSSLWKIIVGAVLIVTAIVVSIVTLGASTPAAIAITTTALTTLGISYGISLAVAGIKFDQFKAMIDVDYDKGLKDTVVDGGVFECLRSDLETEDDTIRWFADRVSNIYIESTVPFGLRSGLTCGVPDFVDAPQIYDELGFRSYLTEKLTVIDRDQGSGRLYKGYATAELYDMNLDFMRFNKEKLFSHLPIEYDCCSDSNELFPMRIWYSEQSFQEERTDNYRVFLPNNYTDIEGEHGEITGAYRLGNSLFIHTSEALWQLPQNVQERVTNEIISFIGTGSFFSIPPRKVIDSNLGSGGSQHKWATVKTPNGVFFISEVEGKIYLHAQGVSEITKGNRNLFKNSLISFLPKQLFDNFGVDFPFINNPANPNGVGYLSNYDTRLDRILLTKRDYLILPDKLALLSITDTVPIDGADFKYCTLNGLFYKGSTQILLSDIDYFENKSFTMSYSFIVIDTSTNSLAGNRIAGWLSYHSYMPNYYIHTQNNFYSAIANDNRVFKHGLEGSFQIFYDKFNPFIVEYVSSTSKLKDATFIDLVIQTIARKYNQTTKSYLDTRYVTFNKITTYNTRQCSGEISIVVKDTQPDTANYLFQQVINEVGKVLATRRDRDWTLNNFKDYVDDYTQPIFSASWDDIKQSYFIDKVVNQSVVNYNKSWQELSYFTDKYVIIRLKFDNFSDVNLTLNFSIETVRS